jgi:phage gpG-like protein
MNLTPEQFTRHLKQQSAAIARYIQRDAPRMMGIEARKHFKQSFLDGGFTDSNLEKWKPAKRTNTGSVWYGFEYGARTRTPDGHPKRWKAKGKYKARKANPVTNYSPAATKRRTLSGRTGDLMNSLQYTVGTAKVTISSNLPYANVHNTGGRISVFGRKSATLPKRQFIGHSTKLNARLKLEINRDIKKILSP